MLKRFLASILRFFGFSTLPMEAILPMKYYIGAVEWDEYDKVREKVMNNMDWVDWYYIGVIEAPESWHRRLEMAEFPGFAYLLEYTEKVE